MMLRTSTTTALFLLLSLVPTTDAFVPVHLNGGASTTTTVGPAPRTPNTSLSMSGGNFFERIFRVTNANLNKVISSLENPEKVIIQAVDDMQVCI